MKTTSKSSGAPDGQPYCGTLDKLSRILTDKATAESRKWLLTQLNKEKLTTRDIYFFALKQAQIRTENKEPDVQTVRFAMLAKQRDIMANIVNLNKQKRKVEDELYNALERRRYKF